MEELINKLKEFKASKGDKAAKEMEETIKEARFQLLEYERILDIYDKREYRKKYLEERRKEEPNLLYPDSDEIYKRYYEQQKKLQEKDITITTLKHLYKELQNDFNNYKNDKDIHYLDGIHHKKLVEKSIGQEIKEPENIDFEDIECKLVIQNKIIEGMQIANELEILDAGGTKEREYPRFLNLKDIADYIEKNNFYFGSVIAESPLSGAIYRYNNYGNKKWQLVGTMLGYA